MHLAWPRRRQASFINETMFDDLSGWGNNAFINAGDTAYAKTIRGHKGGAHRVYSHWAGSTNYGVIAR